MHESCFGGCFCVTDFNDGFSKQIAHTLHEGSFSEIIGIDVIYETK